MNPVSQSVATVCSVALVADARATARAFLDRLRRPTMTAEAVDTVVLVVSELVTNALRHGGGSCTVELAAQVEGLEVCP